jgi:hypothetical protein
MGLQRRVAAAGLVEQFSIRRGWSSLNVTTRNTVRRRRLLSLQIALDAPLAREVRTIRPLDAVRHPASSRDEVREVSDASAEK